MRNKDTAFTVLYSLTLSIKYKTLVSLMCNAERNYLSWWAYRPNRNDLPRNAVGEMMPVLLATTIAIPVSRKGNEKSIACDLSKFILRDVITISAWWLMRAATNPFQRPFCGNISNSQSILWRISDQATFFILDKKMFTRVPDYQCYLKLSDIHIHLTLRYAFNMYL